MSGLREEYEYAGINPDAQNERGYECRHCGYVPSNLELDQGTRCECQKEANP